MAEEINIYSENKMDNLNLLEQIEKLHRLSLDIISNILQELEIDDINNVQLMIAMKLVQYNAPQKIDDIISQNYYLPSNFKFNIKQMLQKDYIRINAESEVETTEKCQAILVKVKKKLFDLGKKEHLFSDLSGLEKDLIKSKEKKR